MNLSSLQPTDWFRLMKQAGTNPEIVTECNRQIAAEAGLDQSDGHIPLPPVPTAPAPVMPPKLQPPRPVYEKRTGYLASHFNQPPEKD
jgi:hypothetical protein